MKQTAKVLEVKGGDAIVEVERTSACAACSKSHDCIACKKKICVKAKNAVGAVKGDRVVIESPSERILGYAALVFVLPLVLAFAGFLISRLFGLSDDISLYICIGIFVLCMCTVLPVLNRSAAMKNKITVICRDNESE